MLLLLRIFFSAGGDVKIFPSEISPCKVGLSGPSKGVFLLFILLVLEFLFFLGVLELEFLFGFFLFLFFSSHVS